MQSSRFNASVVKSVNKCTNSWWKRRKHRYRKAAVVIQSAWRCWVAKNMVMKLRQVHHDKKVIIEKIEEIVEQEVLIPRTIRTLEMKVVLSENILSRMAKVGAPEVIRWCLYNYILHYSTDYGYSLGTVALQVMTTVENIYPTLVNTTLDNVATSNNDSSGQEYARVIKVEQWEDGVMSDVPSQGNYPLQWNQCCACGSGKVKLSTQFLVNSICVEVVIDNPIQLYTPSNVDVEKQVELHPENNISTIVTIVLEGRNSTNDGNNGHSHIIVPSRSINTLPDFRNPSYWLDDFNDHSKKLPISPWDVQEEKLSQEVNSEFMMKLSRDLEADSLIVNSLDLRKANKIGRPHLNGRRAGNIMDHLGINDVADIDDVRFVFKNAVVEIGLVTEIINEVFSSPSRKIEEENLGIIDDDSDNNNGSVWDEAILPSLSPRAISRPVTAKVRLVIEEPQEVPSQTPSPPILSVRIDYDAMAKRIQVLHSYHI
jgi:hypothetical protein